jgi:hypothetical protein
MGSKERRPGLVIFTFPRQTLETSNFRDPLENHLSPTVERDIRRLYTEGLHFQPDPHPISEAVLLPSPPKGIFPSGVDEDYLCRLYAAAAFLMQKPSERRGLMRDQMEDGCST